MTYAGGYMAYSDSNSIPISPDHTELVQNFFRPLNPYSAPISDNFKVEHDGPSIPNGTNKAKGMSLGLYLVKTLVDSYNGRVWAEDHVKGDHTRGARFVVMLPASDK